MERTTNEEHLVNAVGWAKIMDASRAPAHLSARGSGCLRTLHCCGRFAVAQGGAERQVRAEELAWHRIAQQVKEVYASVL